MTTYITGDNMKVWVVWGSSESSDDYGPICFSKKPSEELLSTIANCWDGKYTGSGRDGPGDYGSYVYIEKQRVEVDGELQYFKDVMRRRGVAGG